MIEPELARTVAAIVATGSLDAAAARLHLTPSAVSQRLRAVEARLGRRVLHRTRPVELTDAGRVLVRYARQLDELALEVAAELGDRGGERPAVTVVVDADSLHTWALAPLVAAAEPIRLELLREDQDHSRELLRSGRAAGAITAEREPLPGCTSEPLGVLRYLAVCSAEFHDRWFARGVDPDALRAAPQLRFDGKDDLQRRFLDALGLPGEIGPVHHVPASAAFSEAIRLGMGWGMVPEIECAEEVRTGELILLAADTPVDVALSWQQWRRGSAAVTGVGAALREAATARLRPVDG